jgi:hypothetical protein
VQRTGIKIHCQSLTLIVTRELQAFVAVNGLCIVYKFETVAELNVERPRLEKGGSIAETTIDKGYLLIIVAYSSPDVMISTPSDSGISCHLERRRDSCLPIRVSVYEQGYMVQQLLGLLLMNIRTVLSRATRYRNY